MLILELYIHVWVFKYHSHFIQIKIWSRKNFVHCHSFVVSSFVPLSQFWIISIDGKTLMVQHNLKLLILFLFSNWTVKIALKSHGHPFAGLKYSIFFFSFFSFLYKLHLYMKRKIIFLKTFVKILSCRFYYVDELLEDVALSPDSR